MLTSSRLMSSSVELAREAPSRARAAITTAMTVSTRETAAAACRVDQCAAQSEGAYLCGKCDQACGHFGSLDPVVIAKNGWPS